MMGPGGMMGSGRGPGTGGTAGVDISASHGTLTSTMINTKMLNGEVVHSSPMMFSPMGVVYTFNWTAPANGNPTLNVAGLSSNNDSTSSGDGTGTAVLPITVTSSGINQAPVAQIAGPMTGTAGTPVTFSGAGSSDPDGNITSYAWNFGDGTAGTGVTTMHTYTVGNYTVSLTVTDNTGTTGTAVSTITIAAAGSQSPPVADAGGPYTGNVGMAVTFNGSNSTDADGTIASYSWSFGDGNIGSGVQPSHIYRAPGTYPVSLVVTDNTGATGVSNTSVTITRNMSITATTGAQLYATHCASCHGPEGMGGPDGPVVGATAQAITVAIAQVPEMQSLQLTANEIAAIACYLKEVCQQPPATSGGTPTGTVTDTGGTPAASDSSPVIAAGSLDWLTLAWAVLILMNMRIGVMARQIVKR